MLLIFKICIYLYYETLLHPDQTTRSKKYSPNYQLFPDVTDSILNLIILNSFFPFEKLNWSSFWEISSNNLTVSTLNLIILPVEEKKKREETSRERSVGRKSNVEYKWGGTSWAWKNRERVAARRHLSCFNHDNNKWSELTCAIHWWTRRFSPSFTRICK